MTKGLYFTKNFSYVIFWLLLILFSLAQQTKYVKKNTFSLIFNNSQASRHLRLHPNTFLLWYVIEMLVCHLAVEVTEAVFPRWSFFVSSSLVDMENNPSVSFFSRLSHIRILSLCLLFARLNNSGLSVLTGQVLLSITLFLPLCFVLKDDDHSWTPSSNRGFLSTDFSAAICTCVFCTKLLTTVSAWHFLSL